MAPVLSLGMRSAVSVFQSMTTLEVSQAPANFGFTVTQSGNEPATAMHGIRAKRGR